MEPCRLQSYVRRSGRRGSSARLGWARSSIDARVLSSTESTIALGRMQIEADDVGHRLDQLRIDAELLHSNVSLRRFLRFYARHTRPTVEALTPTRSASRARHQRVTAPPQGLSEDLLTYRALAQPRSTGIRGVFDSVHDVLCEARATTAPSRGLG